MSFIIDTGFEQLYHSSFSKQIQLNPVLTRPLFLHFNSERIKSTLKRTEEI